VLVPVLKKADLRPKNHLTAFTGLPMRGATFSTTVENGIVLGHWSGGWVLSCEVRSWFSGKDNSRNKGLGYVKAL